ncbi:uncharacterized protein LOC134746872 [Cydia strobilella]|uniref:uncharacterized protein LOC134746872 n=1 Tax=Cydia strobilella TaxID=1100964 RepID=UPI0030079219
MFAWIVLLTIFQNENANEIYISKIIEFEEAEKSHLNDESLIECVVDLTQITIIFSPTILILESDTDDNYYDIFFKKMIETFAKRDIPITIQDKGNHDVNQTLDVYVGNVIVIVHFENSQTLFDFEIYRTDKRVKYLVIISELIDDLKLQAFVRRYMDRDITFIIPDPKADKYYVITFPPTMNEKTCEPVEKFEPNIINICLNGTLETDVIFPELIKANFRNCTLRVGMATVFPFSKIPNEHKLKNYELIPQIEGSDVEIIKIIADYFNASIIWHYLDSTDSSSDLPNFFLNGSLDLSAGGLYRIYGDRVSYSGIYAMQAVIWIYAAHRPGRSWVNLVHKLNEIYFFDIFYLLYSITSYCFRKYDNEKCFFRDIILYSWGALVGTSSLPEPKSFKHKMLDVFYLILCMFVSSYMNIQLVSFLTIDGPSISFKTNEDVINSGRIPYLHPIKKYFIQESKYLAFANTSKDCGDFFDCSVKVLESDGVTVILDEYFYLLQASTAVKDEAKILRATHRIITVYQEILVKKDSLIVTGSQKVLERLFEAGICNHLFRQAIGITVVAKANSANQVALSNSYSCLSGCAITLSQVGGLFYFWAFGCVLSVSAFLIEIMWKRQTRSV